MMDVERDFRRRTPAVGRWSTAVLASFAICLAVPVQGQDAASILKAMSDYVTSQKVLSLTFDTDIEVIGRSDATGKGAALGQIISSRPDSAPR